VCVRVCMYVSYVYTYVCVCVCVYVCMYVCMYVCIYECMYVCIHECMYVCMYVSMYVCTCTYTDRRISHHPDHLRCSRTLSVQEHGDSDDGYGAGDDVSLAHCLFDGPDEEGVCDQGAQGRKCLEEAELPVSERERGGGGGGGGG
jgi:hypothetical protein